MNNLGIIVNKPSGITSRDVVNKLNKILATKKIGHTGTLDPMASGVLVCLVGKYTKLVDLITSDEKEYVAKIKLGILTDTLDITGKIVKEEKVKHFDINYIEDVLNNFLGEYEQTIPLYSARHVNGKRLYEYGREGKSVELPKNTVYIKDIELLEYLNDTIKFRVIVSKGTYIRSLIQSICEHLNTIGVMSELTRTRQGTFKISESHNLEDIENNNYKALSLKDLINLKVVEVKVDLTKKIINGSMLNLNYDGYILFREKDEDLALYYFEENIGKLKILLKEK